MRRFVGILRVVFLSAAVAFAERPASAPGHGQHEDKQDRDDHDDRAPIQSGYAVITPATTSGTGLVVFETFGWRRGGDAGTPQAGVQPPDLTTNAVLFEESNRRLSKDLGVAIVDPKIGALGKSWLERKCRALICVQFNLEIFRRECSLSHDGITQTRQEVLSLIDP